MVGNTSCLVIAIAVAACHVAVPLPAGANETLDCAWGGRDTPAGLARAVQAFESASRTADASAQVFERLVHLRFRQAYDLMEADSPRQIAGFKRCVADGLRGLALHGAGDQLLEISSFADLDRMRSELRPESIGILYWTTLCYGPTIQKMSIFRQAAAAKRFLRMAKRCALLDARYDNGGPHRILAEYHNQAPGMMGGDDDLARKHADNAVRIAPGCAQNFICRASNVWRPAKDGSRFNADLDDALSLPDDSCPDGGAEHLQAKEKARELKNQLANRN